MNEVIRKLGLAAGFIGAAVGGGIINQFINADALLVLMILPFVVVGGVVVMVCLWIGG